MIELDELIEEQRQIYWVNASRSWDICVERLQNNHKVAQHFGIEKTVDIIHGADIQTSLDELRKIFHQPIEITEFDGRFILRYVPCSFKFVKKDKL